MTGRTPWSLLSWVRREGGRAGGREGCVMFLLMFLKQVLLYPTLISIPSLSLLLSLLSPSCLVGVRNRMDSNERIEEAEAREEEEAREEAGDGQVFVVAEPVKTKVKAADVAVDGSVRKGEEEGEEEEEVHSHHLRGGPAAH